MRTTKSFFFASIAAIASAACGPNEPTPASSSSTSSSSSGAGGASLAGITGTAKDTYTSSVGDVVVPKTNSWSTIEAIVGDGAAQKSYPGSVDAQGNVRIPDVPEGPYQLVLTDALPANAPANAKPSKTVIVNDARSVELGYIYSYRADLQTLSKPTMLTLDATLGVPWQAVTKDMQGNVTQPLDDSLQFVVQNAAIFGLWFSQGTPKNGDTQIAGWANDATMTLFGTDKVPNPIIDGTKGDVLTILHNVSQTVGTPTPDGNPWNGHPFTSTQESFQPASFTMTDGGTSKLSGAFKPISQTSFAMDFRGSEWIAMIAESGVPYTGSYTEVVVFREPGAPEPATGTYSLLLDITPSPNTVYTNQNKDCQGATCDAAACGGPCDPGKMVLPGDFSHTYSYGDPFTSGQALLGIIYYFSNRVTSLLPDKTPERLVAKTNAIGPAAEANGKPIQPAVGFPKAIKVAGKDTPYDQITAGVGMTPVISWSAPRIGTPTHYTVAVVDLTDSMLADGSVQPRRMVANIITRGTDAVVPNGVMEKGRNYYFEVSAYVREGDNLAAPFHYAQHESFAQMFTGVVTP